MMFPLWTAGPSVSGFFLFFLLMAPVLQLHNVSKRGPYWIQLPGLSTVCFHLTDSALTQCWALTLH